MSVKKLYITYEAIHGLIERSVPSLKAFRPDVILAVGGGGFIPGRVVREHLKVPMIGVVLAHYDDNTNEKISNEPRKVQWIDANTEAMVRGKRVLVVDEVDDSRETMAYLVKELQHFQPAATAVYVLHNKLRQKSAHFEVPLTYIPGEEIPDLWIVYPWEATNYAQHLELAKSNEAS